MTAFGAISSTTDMMTNADGFVQDMGVLSRTGSIDLKVATTTNLYTVPTARVAIVTDIVFRVTAATAFTVAPTLGVGVAAGEADIMGSTVLTGFTVLGGLFRYSCEGFYVSVAAASVIKLGIDVGATATTATGEVTVLGFLI